jgi:putative tryptophan/tyrosine transport system substrate-binding protein
VRERADALVTLNCAHINNLAHRAPEQLAGPAAKHRLPGMYYRRTVVAAGGLMSYAPNYADTWPRVAVYVDKILKGAKPADPPVEQPIRFHLAINLKTATALGLTISPLLLFQADEVIR